MCVECGKTIKGKDMEGSMKHPYCKKCFKKVWNNDYDKYLEWLACCHP